jgi:hypothetical protein
VQLVERLTSLRALDLNDRAARPELTQRLQEALRAGGVSAFMERS